jgi:hypothetical protein
VARFYIYRATSRQCIGSGLHLIPLREPLGGLASDASVLYQRLKHVKNILPPIAFYFTFAFGDGSLPQGLEGNSLDPTFGP